MAVPKVAFIGNCQAQALSSLAGHLGTPIEVVPLPPVFEVAAFDTAEVRQRLASADVIFNQRVAEDYVIEFARPSAIRREYGARAISWPNIYFDGYFPGIGYVYQTSGKVIGPLGDYHIPFFRECWERGESMWETTRRWLAGEAFDRDPVQASLEQLRDREEGLDVAISDYLAGVVRKRQVFYAMNHPSDEVLLETLSRLLGKVGIGVGDPSRLSTYPYTLDLVRVPAVRSLSPFLSGGFDFTDRIVGRGLVLDGRRLAHADYEVFYDWLGLVNVFFSLYEHVFRER
jgi:Polysaccharide biosynthesis enzyme WcbI